MDVLPSVPSIIRLRQIAEVIENFNTKWGKSMDKQTKQKLITFIDWTELYLQIIGKIQQEFENLQFKSHESYDIMEENLLKTKLDMLKTGVKIIGDMSSTFRTTVHLDQDYKRAYAQLLSKLTGCTDTVYDTNYKEFILGELNSLENQANEMFGRHVVEVMSSQERNAIRQTSRAILKELQNTRRNLDENCTKFYKIMKGLTY